MLFAVAAPFCREVAHEVFCVASLLAVGARAAADFGKRVFSWPALAQSTDPMPSWNAGRTKQSILDFVAAVTREGSPDFVPEPERIATFDNDGTLWVEQPMYIQLAFALDRVKTLAPLHPEWKSQQPFQAVLQGDLETLANVRRERRGGADHGPPTPTWPPYVFLEPW